MGLDSPGLTVSRCKQILKSPIENRITFKSGSTVYNVLIYFVLQAIYRCSITIKVTITIDLFLCLYLLSKKSHLVHELHEVALMHSVIISML